MIYSLWRADKLVENRIMDTFSFRFLEKVSDLAAPSGFLKEYQRMPRDSGKC